MWLRRNGCSLQWPTMYRAVGSVTGVDVVGLSAANVRLHDITAEGHGAIGLRARAVRSSLIRRRFRRNRATIAETPLRNTKSPRLQIPPKGDTPESGAYG